MLAEAAQVGPGNDNPRLSGRASCIRLASRLMGTLAAIRCGYNYRL